MNHVIRYLNEVASTLNAIAEKGDNVPPAISGTLANSLATVARALKTPDPQPPGSDYPRIRADALRYHARQLNIMAALVKDGVMPDAADLRGAVMALYDAADDAGNPARVYRAVDRRVA